eukprot:CAMPEP_0194363694 /NCGR_PEP_ID=MMETSP0174-20130528/11547_1 /TAXON_ID=216777 /ORGANISM="Proboscia alata, Strain PI-D3" /LENGTH=35 /DNA_ID= /DNA_START= /DNA_END= /DNA_ORIENTATION=
MGSRHKYTGSGITVGGCGQGDDGDQFGSALDRGMD